MRNKSRKRILHEQRVKIDSLERTIRNLRVQKGNGIYEPITLRGKVAMPPHIKPHTAEYEYVLRVEGEKMMHGFVENLLHSKALEVKKSDGVAPWGSGEVYDFTLTVLKRRW